jgi:hypothetical protein
LAEKLQGLPCGLGVGTRSTQLAHLRSARVFRRAIQSVSQV